MSAALEVVDLTVCYGPISALQRVSLRVEPGQIVTLVGGNGAGKTTLLKAIAGAVKIRGGFITHEGRRLNGLPAHRVVGRGVAHVPEGRLVFANLTVEENLQLGAYLRNDKAGIAADLEEVFTWFPRLKERLKQSAGTLSGGEQQMLAIGRALLSRPKFLMLDEPSLGIAPLLTRKIFDQIAEINRVRRLPMLLVEQNANLALEVADYGYVLETGTVALQGPSGELRTHPKLKAAYLGA